MAERVGGEHRRSLLVAGNSASIMLFALLLAAAFGLVYASLATLVAVFVMAAQRAVGSNLARPLFSAVGPLLCVAGATFFQRHEQLKRW